MKNSSCSVLVVDADSNSRNSLMDSFEKIGWIAYSAKNSQQAIQGTYKYFPDIILMDINLPDRDGISSCYLIKNDLTASFIYPIIIMSTSGGKKQLLRSIEAGCDDFIVKPFKFDILLTKIKSLLDYYQKKGFFKKDSLGIQEREEKEIIICAKQVLEQTFIKALEGEIIDYSAIQDVVNKMVEILHKDKILPLAYKLKSHNDYTYTHSINMASISMAFAYNLGWNDLDLQIMGEGSLLHDIGMTSIDLQIYIKQEKLSEDEFDIIKKHPLHSIDILKKQNIGDEVKKIAIEHHERIDGTGYPYKLRDKQISKYGKLAAIIDVYDAMTTDRCYRNAFDSQDAVITMSNSPGQFDSELFKKFARLVNSETIGK